MSGDTKRKLTAELIPAPGQGDSNTFSFNAHTVAQSATAEGTAVAAAIATPMEFHGALWNSIAFHGDPWKLMRFHGVP